MTAPAMDRDVIGDRALTIFALALGVGFAGASPALAQEDLPQWASGCAVMAASFRSQAASNSEAYRKSDEAEGFWRAALERVESDPAKRAERTADARKALDADLVGKTPAQRSKILDTAFTACASIRGFVESQQKTGEVKP